jgi:hypothetical protein
MRALRVCIARLLRATVLVVRDKRIPRPVRWAAGLGLMPMPGPFDELVLLVVAVPLFVFYRGPLREAWHATAAPAEARTRVPAHTPF